LKETIILVKNVVLKNIFTFIILTILKKILKIVIIYINK